MHVDLRTSRKTAGFSLIELLVVIAIVCILMGLVLPILGAMQGKRKIVAAQTEVKSIAAAALLYYESLQCYPPDTGTADGSFFDTGKLKDDVIEPDSIFKYLGRKITDQKTGQEYGPFLNIKPKYLREEAGLQIYMDPWNIPYQLDAKHSRASKDKTGRNVGKVDILGEPYADSVDEELRILDVKVWSNGPDKASDRGSAEDGPPKGVDVDNLASWRN